MTDVFDIEIPEGHGIIHKLDHTGDQYLMWSRKNAEEVQSSRHMFEDLTSKGYIAYKAEGKKGERGQVIRAFDPAAERIILVKQTQGG